MRCTKGEQEFVNRVLMSGVEHTKPHIVNRAVVIREGAPLSQEKMLQTQRNLYDLGIFNEVQTAIQNPEGDEREKNVLFQIKEAKALDDQLRPRHGNWHRAEYLAGRFAARGDRSQPARDPGGDADQFPRTRPVADLQVALRHSGKTGFAELRPAALVRSAELAVDVDRACTTTPAT